MPFRPSPFVTRFERLRRFRMRRPWASYVIAVAGVAAATLARQALPGASAPFVMFYPAVIVAALTGGFSRVRARN